MDIRIHLHDVVTHRAIARCSSRRVDAWAVREFGGGVDLISPRVVQLRTHRRNVIECYGITSFLSIQTSAIIDMTMAYGV